MSDQTPTIQELLDKIKQFLSNRVESKDESYAKVDKKDLDELYSLFYEVIALKWGASYDDILPVDLQLADRHRQSFVYPWAMEHNNLEDAINVIRSASDIADRLIRIQRHNQFEAKDVHDKLKSINVDIPVVIIATWSETERNHVKRYVERMIDWWQATTSNPKKS